MPDVTEKTGTSSARRPDKKGRKLTWRARLALLAFGLALGLGLCELGLYLYFEHFLYRRFATAPAYRKDPAHLRLAVLGESTAKGTPYNEVLERAGFPREFNLLAMTGLLLEHRFARTDIKIDPYAVGGWPLEQAVKHYWDAAAYKPDLIVLYSGQNERWSYYSSNMKPPPRALSFLGGLNTGRTLLRYLYQRQADRKDLEYRGDFFSDGIIPACEAQYNRQRYRRYAQILARHCRDEKIGLIFVIPQCNYLFPPRRSVYDGPEARRDGALRLFKQAYYLRHFAHDDLRAEKILRQLQSFCQFADLSFELGDLLYRRGKDHHAAAKVLLREALDTDALPERITSDYRQTLMDVAKEFDVPTVDMDEIVTTQAGAVLPDETCYVDTAHLTPKAYEALTRRILAVIRDRKLLNLPAASGEMTLTPEEWTRDLGLTPPAVGASLAAMARFVAQETRGGFLRLWRYRWALERISNVRRLQNRPELDPQIAELTATVKAEEARMLQWLRQDNTLPASREGGHD